MKINKNIHQVYGIFDDGKKLEDIEVFKQNTMKTKQFADKYGYEYKLWSLTDCEELLVDYFSEYIELWTNFRYPIQKADFIRYCILYIYGGWYIDCDVYPLKDISPLENNNQVFVRGAARDLPYNAVMGSMKDNSLFLDIMKDVEKRTYEKQNKDIYEVWKGRLVFQTTGQNMLKNHIAKKDLHDILSVVNETKKINISPNNPYFHDNNISSWYKGKHYRWKNNKQKLKPVLNRYLNINKSLIWIDKECDFAINNFPNTITWDKNIKKDILDYAINMDKDNCIIDAGGHIGDGAVAFAHTLKEVGRGDIFVYAIEPEKYKCEFIEKIKEVNGLQNLIVINTGLADDIGYYKKKPSNSKNTGASRFLSNGDFIFTKLDNLKKEGKIKHKVGVIHYDLEGMEQKALDGSVDILNTDKPYLSAENHKKDTFYNLPDGYNFIKIINSNQIYRFNKEELK